MKVSQETILLAAVVDQLSMLVWFQSEDGAKGRNRPQSVLSAILDSGKKKDEIVAFDSGEEFDKAWKKLVGGE